SSFKSFPKRAPARASRSWASVLASVRYLVVRLNGPAPTGATYTFCSASWKLSAIQSFSSIFAAAVAPGAGSFFASAITLFRDAPRPRHPVPETVAYAGRGRGRATTGGRSRTSSTRTSGEPAPEAAQPPVFSRPASETAEIVVDLSER